MEFRSQKAALAFVGLLWMALPAAAEPLRYQVRHDHLRKSGAGALTIDEAGIAYQESAEDKKKHAWRWAWSDVQQLTIEPRRLTVLTYQDNRWMLGADREQRFALAAEGSFTEAYEFLRGRLDQRLVAALAPPEAEPLWTLPAKHLLRFGGSHGELSATAEGMVYRTARKGESRAWRYSDIENVSSSGPFQLTITTYERARSHYGGLKGFNFQLKEPLDRERYDALWRRLNESKGLQFLTSYQQRSN